MNPFVPTRVAGLGRLAIVLSVSLFVGSREATAASILLTESFQNSTAPGWSLFNSAILTGNGTIDPAGQGWLRLTTNGTNQTGLAIDTTALPFNAGLDIKFNYAIWGGTGADGLVMALVDGSQSPTTAGGLGGSLGYAQNGNVNGLTGGILGVGLDAFGNFANPTEGRQNGPGQTPTAVTIRGPGNGHNAKSGGVTNYDFLTTSGTLPTVGGQNPIELALATPTRPASPTDFRQAEVIVDTTQIAKGHIPVTVILQVGTAGSPQTVISKFDAYAQVVAFYGNDPTKIPATFKIAFTGSTGGLTDFIEVQQLQVDSIADVPGFASVPEPPTQFGCGLVLIALSLLGRRLRRKRQ